jgi:hypothetical protein
MADTSKTEGAQFSDSAEPASDTFGGTPQVSALIASLAAELDRIDGPDRAMVVSANNGTLTVHWWPKPQT